MPFPGLTWLSRRRPSPSSQPPPSSAIQARRQCTADRFNMIRNLSADDVLSQSVVAEELRELEREMRSQNSQNRRFPS